MAKDPACRSTGQVLDVLAGLKVTSAGSRDNDANDWQVNPAGPPSVALVITVKPVAKVPNGVRAARRHLVGRLRHFAGAVREGCFGEDPPAVPGTVTERHQARRILFQSFFMHLHPDGHWCQ